ncbi:translation initiation factor IF-3 [Streptomyces sp. NPDC059371]|uniref:translation initiation factor IF-3 n=1 Tax=Streptomyces sp. NPDC059371 TaxID=3346812 RepID=UPI0036880D9C
MTRPPRMTVRLMLPLLPVVGALWGLWGCRGPRSALSREAARGAVRGTACAGCRGAAPPPPPVCKLMDYGKFKYESAMKAREARKNQAHTVIKEMKLRPKIDPHDYDTKKGHVVRFLKQGDKVKITIMFRGREQSRPELGYRLLQRLATDVEDLGFIESNPKQDGRNMIMVLGPHKKKTEAMAEAREAQAARKADAKANPGRSQNAAEEAEADGDITEGAPTEAESTESTETPAEASAEA